LKGGGKEMRKRKKEKRRTEKGEWKKWQCSVILSDVP
jgi:hypothetical protein